MAAQTANADDVQTGTDAYEHVREHWQDLGLGMVETEYQHPYLIVSRGGADWTLFLPLTDEDPVLVPDDAINDEATTRHIPKEFRAEKSPDKEDMAKLQRAFDHLGGGMFPLEDGFNISFEDGGRYSLVISHTDGAVTVEEE